LKPGRDAVLDVNIRNPALKPLALKMAREVRLPDGYVPAVEMLLANLHEAGDEPVRYSRASLPRNRYQPFDREDITVPIWRLTGRYVLTTRPGPGRLGTFQATPLLRSMLSRTMTGPTFAETIILRGRKEWNATFSDFVGEVIDYEDTEETSTMRAGLLRYNDLMAGFVVVDGYGERHTTHLARIFNNASFVQGGRFYRASYQALSSKERPHIRIDGGRVVELDFSSIHPTMLFLRRGSVPEGDPYAVNGFDRRILKLAFNMGLNAESKSSAEGALRRTLREMGAEEPDATATRYIDGLRPAIPSLADDLYTGVGLKLQRQDSEIAARIMARFVNAEKPILVMHDSFLVTEKDEVELRVAMIEEFKAVLATDYEPGIKRGAP
jgi:hypothetical protein